MVDYKAKIPTIRLYYIAIEKFTRYGTGETKLGTTYGISSPFKLPCNMSIKDACKVVSYLSDKIESEKKLTPGCEKSVAMVSSILNKYGFDKVESKEKGHHHTISDYHPLYKIKTAFPKLVESNRVIDLFTIGGSFELFQKSDLHDRYFEWYIEGVTKQEIEDIYRKIGQEYLLQETSTLESKTNQPLNPRKI